MIKDAFSHVAPVDSLDETIEAINRDEINLTYAPSPASPEAQKYIDNLILGENGDFKSLPLHDFGPQYEDFKETISIHKNLAIIEGHSREDLEPEVIYSQMTQLPEREGKYEFAVALSKTLKTFWDAQAGRHPIRATLMEKIPCEKPNMHIDGMEEGREIRALWNMGEGTRYMSNIDAHVRDKDGTLKGLLGPLSDYEDKTDVRRLPKGAFSMHKGVKLVCNDPAGIEYVVDPVALNQNPLGHAEAPVKDCAGQTRLQLMIDQAPDLAQ